MSILLLLLASAPGGGHMHHGHEHASIQHWHMRTPDGTSVRDFGRRLGHQESVQTPRIEKPLENFQLSNGARVGFGFVQGRHLGFKLKSPF